MMKVRSNTTQNTSKISKHSIFHVPVWTCCNVFGQELLCAILIYYDALPKSEI